ncbi:MAG: 6-phosphogluconolactonase [Prolixibacteraceae bacterium]|nr:6-phosphogluconolactonase [Prolixibacteraceae bacterium]
MDINIFKNTDEIAEAFAKILFENLKKQENAPVHIALSGGSTPKTIFSYLSEKYGSELANDRFHFWWGDDRCVPPSHNDSNYKWANELWLKPIGIPQKNIHRVKGENEAEKEAVRYSEEIIKHVPLENGFPVFDIMLLGLGEDGHTASIFPNQMELLESDKICEVASHPITGQKRITLTGPVINNSNHIILLAVGEKKAAKVREVIVDQKKSLPAGNIMALNGKLTWLLDKFSAQKLY